MHTLQCKQIKTVNDYFASLASINCITNKNNIALQTSINMLPTEYRLMHSKHAHTVVLAI